MSGYKWAWNQSSCHRELVTGALEVEHPVLFVTKTLCSGISGLYAGETENMSYHLLTSQCAERGPQDLLSSLNSRSTSDILCSVLCILHLLISAPPHPPPSRSALLPWRPSTRNGGTEKTGTQQTRVIAILPPALSSEVEENTLVTSNTAFHCTELLCEGSLINVQPTQINSDWRLIDEDWCDQSGAAGGGWISRRSTPGGIDSSPLRDGLSPMTPQHNHSTVTQHTEYDTLSYRQQLVHVILYWEGKEFTESDEFK